MRQYLLAVLVLLALLSFGEAAFSRALTRSKQRPPQCIRLNDRISYPITIPTLGTYDYNTTKPTRRFVSGPLIATRARPPHLNSGSILFEADAAIGAVMGVLTLEHLGRCDVTTTGREALLNLTVTSPKGLHLRLTPWKKIPIGNFFVFLSRGLKRVFTRVERFPYSWENNMITFFRDQNIARMDMPSFPLMYVLPDLKGKPAADLTLKQVTIRSHFKFGRLQFNNRRRKAQQATTNTAAPATAAAAAPSSPAPIESHVNAAKAVTQMSEATVAVNADFKHHIRSTFTGRLDLSPLGFMMTSLKTLTNVRARAYSNDKRFKLMAYLPESLTIIPRRVTIEDPILVIRKKNVADLTEFQNLEKKNTQVLIRGALEFLDTVSEAEIAFGQYVSTLTANVSFNNLVSATLRGRSKNIEGREDLDFDLWARFNAGFLTYLSRKANREIRRAARHHTGIVTNNRFARLLTKTERAIEKSQHRMDMLKRRLINGESLAITKLQKRIAKKEHTLSLLLMRLKALQQSDSGALNANNDTITHQIEVTEHLIEKLRMKSEEVTGELSVGLSPTDLYVVHTLQEKLNRYVERYNASLYAPGEIAKVTKIISITQPKLSALQQTGDVAGINKVVMLQNKYSNLEREYEKSARASQRIANLKQKLEYFEAEIAAMTGGDVDAMNATATTGPAARLQKLKQNLALYQTRLKQISALPERIAQVKQLGTQIVERIRELQTGGPAAIRPAVSNLQELQQRVAVINAEIAKINTLNPKARIASLAANLAKIRTKYFAKNAAMKKKLPTLAKYELVSLKLQRAKEMQGLLNDRAAKLKSELALTQKTFNTVPQNRNTKDIQQQVLILNKLVVDVIRGLTAQDDLKNAQKDIADLDAQIARAKAAKTKATLTTKKASLQAKLTSLSAVANGVAAAKASINQVSVRLLQLGHPVPPQYVHLQVQIAGINHRLRKIATILAKEPMIRSEISKMRNSVQGDQRMALDALEQSLADTNQHMIRLDALYFELHTLQGQGVGAFNPAFSNSIPELQNELKKVNQFISSANTMLSTEQRLKQAITETKAQITQIHPTALAGDLPTLKRQIERINRLIEKYLPHSQPSASLRYNLDEVRKEMQEAMMATPHGHKAQILQAELNALQFKLEDLEHLVKRKEIYKRRIEQIRRRMGRIQSKAGFGNEPDRISKLQNKLAVVTAEINRKLVRLAKLRARLTYVDPHTRKIRILEVERKELVDQLNRLKDKLELMIETEESIQVPVGRVVAVFHDATSRRLQRAINFLEARVARLQTFRTRLAAKGGALDASHINIFTVKEAKSHLSFRELATTGKFRRVAVTVEVNDLTVKVYAFLNPNKPRRFARRVLRKAIKKILYHS